MKKVALYVRVSTEEQRKRGLSVDNQIDALKKYCSENDYIIADIYNDAGISARKKYTKRPALLRLMKDCQDKKIDLILITKLDRFFRSVSDYYAVMEQIDVPWRAIWEDYETETASGIFKVNIMLSVAQSEADRTSERIKTTLTYKRERGDYVGSAPIGYVIRKGNLIKDETKQDAMNAFFQKYLSTFSIISAIEEADLYGLKLNKKHMRQVLRNPVYYGETSQGYKCDPYITKDQHDIIVSNIAKNARQTKYPNRTFIFSGLCVCGYCNRRMASKATNRMRKTGQVKVYKKYICEHKHDMKIKCQSAQISEKTLETSLLNSLDKMLEDYRINIISINSKIDGSGLKKKKDLEAKLKRLSNLYLDGDIDAEEYQLKRDKIKTDISNIIIDPIPEPVILPSNWKEVYTMLDEEHKRSFWLSIIKSIIVTNENKENPIVEFVVLYN